MEAGKTVYPSVDPEAANHFVNDSPPNYYPPSKPEPFAQPTTATPTYMQQQPQSNVMVVTQPPQRRVVSHGYQSSDIGSSAYILAVVVSVIGFCFCWEALICSIPAIIYANKAKAAVDEEYAKKNRNISLILSGVALVVGLLGVVVIGVVIWLYVQNGFRTTTTYYTYTG